MAESMGTARTALVVDDDEFVRTIIARQLQRLGATVTTAADGEIARRALREPGAFDVVICDLKMPGVDGVELLRDFAELQPSAALILMSSAEPKLLRAAEQIAQTRQLRILGTLQKPVSVAALETLLARLSEQRPAPATRDALAPVSANELRAAIAAEEIDVYVQPKVDLRTGRLAGAEALARWLKPAGGVVPPGAFIGVAERSGLMDALTDLVLRQALSACGQWSKQGLHTHVSINIPIESLDRLNLPEQVTASAERFGVRTDQIVLEVTETGVMKDLARSLDVVTRLRLRGFQLSIDDFGTGYSSLEQLRRFPFTELKIDRAFVDGAARDAGLRSIVESSIRLARDLQLTTVAEGVEKQADSELMAALGCDLVQGYYFAKPMPKGDLPAWAEQRRAPP